MDSNVLPLNITNQQLSKNQEHSKPKDVSREDYISTNLVLLIVTILVVIILALLILSHKLRKQI